MRTSIVDGRAVERLLLLAGALRSGLIDALGNAEPRSAAQVAAVAGADLRATRIVLEALAAEGLVEQIPSHAQGGALFRLTPLARAHLVDEGPDLERAGLLHQVNKVRGWLELPEVIRTGRPASRGAASDAAASDAAPHAAVRDAAAPDAANVRRAGSADTRPKDVRTRSLAMGERDLDVLMEVVDCCLAYGGAVGTMIDVGGAVGHLARCFLRRGVRATLFDQEDVIPLAREFLGPDAEVIDLMTGDYTVSFPPGPFDLVYFGNVYHIYSPETNALVTREAYSAVSPGGIIAIQDYILGRSAQAALFAVNMLRSTMDGGVWTEEQHRGWLEGAGFVDIEVVDLASASTHLVLARRP